ncbi:MAG: class II aldolase/adducin family protein [bacterium]
MFDKKDIKNNILEIGQRLYKSGLTSGISGNISCRCKVKIEPEEQNLSTRNGQIYITATSTCLGEMNETEVVLLDEEGSIVENNNIKPSSESMMHVEIYKIRPEINAVIHAHPPFSTALAVSGEKNLQAILAEPVVTFGSSIPVVEYETPSTIKLAKAVAKYFEKNDAVLMANHGVTVCGRNLKETFYKLETLEFYSRVYLYSGLLGKRSELPEEKIQELLKFRHC